LPGLLLNQRFELRRRDVRLACDFKRGNRLAFVRADPWVARAVAPDLAREQLTPRLRYTDPRKKSGKAVDR